MQGPTARCLQLVKSRVGCIQKCKHRGKITRGLSVLTGVGFTTASCSLISSRDRKHSPVFDLAATGRNVDVYQREKKLKIHVYQILLAVNWCLFAAKFAVPQLFGWGVKANIYINQGEWWRFFTPMFLHLDLAHCLINSYSLNNLGPTVEKTAGKERFLTIYLIAGFCGNLASYIMSPNAYSAGASGAIFGLGGALAVFCARHRDLMGPSADRMLGQLRDNLVINVVFGLLNRQIDNWGHMGGLVGGALAAYLLGPNFVVIDRKGRIADRPPIALLATKPK